MSINPPEKASGAASLARPECRTCGGTGWKRVQEVRHGKTVESAARCECVHGSKIERLLKQARIPARYEHCELSNFDHYGPLKSLAPAHLAASRFVEEYPVESAGLLIIGPIGVGKTHLAVGIMKELMIKKGAQCLFYDYRELLKEIQNSWNPQVQVTEMDVLNKIFDAEVLVLDELGAVRPSEWVWDTVSHILNTRYNDERTTIITTNYQDLPPGGTTVRTTDGRQQREETLGDRIAERMRSRLHEMCRIVNVQGDDFRMKYQSHSPR